MFKHVINYITASNIAPYFVKIILGLPVIDDLSFYFSIFREFKTSKGRIKTFKGTVPPVAAYRTIAEVLNILILNFILQMNMTAETATNIFIIAEKINHFPRIC